MLSHLGPCLVSPIRWHLTGFASQTQTQQPHPQTCFFLSFPTSATKRKAFHTPSCSCQQSPPPTFAPLLNRQGLQMMFCQNEPPIHPLSTTPASRAQSSSFLPSVLPTAALGSPQDAIGPCHHFLPMRLWSPQAQERSPRTPPHPPSGSGPPLPTFKAGASVLMASLCSANTPGWVVPQDLAVFWA